MAQDSTGFLWIGTQDGLNRFDGSEFRVYKADRDDPWSLTQNYVLALASDSDGSLWVGTRNSGLNRYDPLLDRFENIGLGTTHDEEKASDRISAMMLDKDHRLWVANASGRMLWLDRATSTLLPAPMAMSDALRSVRCMMQSRDGRVWLGTRDGLWRVDADGQGLREMRASSSDSLNVFALAQTSDGRIWVGTDADGLYAMDPDGMQIQHYSRGKPTGRYGPARSGGARPACGCGWILVDCRRKQRLGAIATGFGNLFLLPARPVPRNHRCRQSAFHVVAWAGWLAVCRVVGQRIFRAQSEDALIQPHRERSWKPENLADASGSHGFR